MVRTAHFHSANGGSIPSRATKLYIMFNYNQLSNIKSHKAYDETLLFQTMNIHDDAGDVYKAEITEDVFRIYTTKNGQYIDFSHNLLLKILTQVEKTQFEIK
jgi:hypothetical protein